MLINHLSLGRPLKFEHTFIYIRDTILLAPAGKGSLAQLGKLYENDGDLSKRVISKEDIKNMGAFFKRDEKGGREFPMVDTGRFWGYKLKL